MSINIDLILKSMPRLAAGALTSMGIAFLALIIGTLGGTALALMLVSRRKSLRWIAHTYTTIVRGTPMLIQIVFLYYVLSSPALHLSAYACAVVAIGCNSAAYMSQVIRSGIMSVSYGQIEAARALGIGQYDLLRYIIFPQALRIIAPALGNEMVTLIKDSSLASLIGVVELYKEGQAIISITYDALSLYCAIAAWYLLMTTTLTMLVNRLEIYLNRHAGHQATF